MSKQSPYEKALTVLMEHGEKLNRKQSDLFMVRETVRILKKLDIPIPKKLTTILTKIEAEEKTLRELVANTRAAMYRTAKGRAFAHVIDDADVIMGERHFKS